MGREFLSVTPPPFSCFLSPVLSISRRCIRLTFRLGISRACCRNCSWALIPSTADSASRVASFGFSCRNIQGDRPEANRLHMEQGAITFFFFPIVPPCHFCILSDGRNPSYRVLYNAEVNFGTTSDDTPCAIPQYHGGGVGEAEGET